MTNTTDLLEVIWAKTDSQTGRTHPLIAHMYESAAVAAVIWHEILVTPTRAAISRSLGLTEEEAATWAIFLSGVHDIGKASPVFQRMWGPAQPMLEAHGLVFHDNCEPLPHGRITALTLRKILPGLFGVREKIAKDLARLAGGHHGVFDSADVLKDAPPRSLGERGWCDLRAELVALLATASSLQGTPVNRELPGYALLAGLVTVSDWIASSRDHFPYEKNSGLMRQPERYMEMATGRAKAALQRLGWLARFELPDPLDFQSLFNLAEPRPLQVEAIALAEELEHPALVLIEAPMGEGKTEAAIFLAERLRQRHGLRGSFFGLPTQATTNQMFGRVVAALTDGADYGTANLMLLLGHASLSAEFELIRREAEQAFSPRAIDTEESTRATVAAGEWFTHRKRGLLAAFGVGTVDQALMAALQSKHVFVRLLGLSGKVVIIDEVHAYDTYMSELLQRLVSWLRAAGTTVIMLSATLPSERRTELLRAFVPGTTNLAGTAPYPAITVASGSTVRSISFLPTMSNRRVRLAVVPYEARQMAAWICERLVNGGCAAVVCNTVARAQEIFRACRELMPDSAEDGYPVVDILHSRYPFEEREERERRSLGRFGKPGSGLRPWRAVLVATQIIEQSLDLDFDLMVSELPPVDLLFQRMGRLWRHERGIRPTGAQPTLGLVEVEVDDDGSPVFPLSDRRVYEEHVLLRSWLVLRERTEVALPADISPWIEAVYSASWATPSEARLQRQLLASLEKLRATREKEVGEATMRYLPQPGAAFQLDKLTSMGCEDDESLHPVFRALTRLADRSVTVACLFRRGSEIFLDRDGERPISLAVVPSHQQTMAMLRRSCSLSDRRVVSFVESGAVPSSWKKSPLLRNCHAMLFDESGVCALGGWRLRLSPDVGITVEENPSC